MLSKNTLQIIICSILYNLTPALSGVKTKTLSEVKYVPSFSLLLSKKIVHCIFPYLFFYIPLTQIFQFQILLYSPLFFLPVKKI